ncbi:MAG: dihydropteroate synthase [Pseudomonadales bacterium]|nr:dihydropteroate synthase [Pseudomonadales bacterium]
MDKQNETATVSDCSGFSYFKRLFDLTEPAVMGVLNVTPDSFSDGGRHLAIDSAVGRGLEMAEQGAIFIDVGGESTRPGAAPVATDEELARVIPVIEALKRQTTALISIDTSSAKVMEEAYSSGADLINDVRALRQHEALEVCAKLPIPVCLMHMQGEPGSMQDNPSYENVTNQVLYYLKERIKVCERAGINKNRLIIDPGFGFGKSLAHNLSLLKNLREFKQIGVPLLVGMSRKRMIGEVLEKPVEQRMVGSVAVAVIAAMNGASIIRVHDVAETVEAIKMTQAVIEAK